MAKKKNKIGLGDLAHLVAPETSSETSEERVLTTEQIAQLMSSELGVHVPVESVRKNELNKFSCWVYGPRKERQFLRETTEYLGGIGQISYRWYSVHSPAQWWAECYQDGSGFRSGHFPEEWKEDWEEVSRHSLDEGGGTGAGRFNR